MLPIPLEFGLAGSIDLAAGPTGQATCAVQTLSPVNIPSIGFVCITPGGPCPVGARHCGPGPVRRSAPT